jgi:hypothetical protein
MPLSAAEGPVHGNLITQYVYFTSALCEIHTTDPAGGGP